MGIRSDDYWNPDPQLIERILTLVLWPVVSWVVLTFVYFSYVLYTESNKKKNGEEDLKWNITERNELNRISNEQRDHTEGGRATSF